MYNDQQEDMSSYSEKITDNVPTDEELVLTIEKLQEWDDEKE